MFPFHLTGFNRRRPELGQSIWLSVFRNISCSTSLHRWGVLRLDPWNTPQGETESSRQWDQFRKTTLTSSKSLVAHQINIRVGVSSEAQLELKRIFFSFSSFGKCQKHKGQNLHTKTHTQTRKSPRNTHTSPHNVR